VCDRVRADLTGMCECERERFARLTATGSRTEAETVREILLRRVKEGRMCEVCGREAGK